MRRMRRPSLANTPSNMAVNLLSRSRIKKRELSCAVAEADQEVAGLLGHPGAAGVVVSPRRWTRRVACSTTARAAAEAAAYRHRRRLWRECPGVVPARIAASLARRGGVDAGSLEKRANRTAATW